MVMIIKVYHVGKLDVPFDQLPEPQAKSDTGTSSQWKLVSLQLLRNNKQLLLAAIVRLLQD